MRLLLITVFTTSSLGCMASLTPQGAAVRAVTATQKDRDCQFVTVVTASESMGSSTGGDAQSAMNKVRNKVAEVGGNVMLIVSTNSDMFSSTVVAEALKCTFTASPSPAAASTSDTIFLNGGR